MAETLFIGSSADGARAELPLDRANRHGLIAGATGTGKTVTVQRLIEGFSAAGVPVFVADVKGDLAGLAMAGSPIARTHASFAERAVEVGDSDWRYAATPVQLWDLFGQAGHPVRTTISEMGPILLARLLDLSEVQAGVLTIAFHLADAEGLLLLDLDDLGAMLREVAERADELTITYGNVSKASVGAIQRALLQLRAQDGERFFGEPALDIADFLTTDEDGRGIVNVLAADRLMAAPTLYATFLLWLLSEIVEELPEIGDADKPRLVFVFDEAHLLFDDAPKALLDTIESTVRLVRSKGVGLYFVTQNPIDVPDAVASQLGHRIQHALRAFTPRDQAAVRAAATSFRANRGVDVASAITELKVGEALVSLLQADGAPTPVERTLIAPPRSRVGPLTPEERRVIIDTDAVGAKYDEASDRESAEELLTAKADEASAAAAAAKAQDAAEKDAAARTKAHAKAAKEAERARLAAQRRADRAERDADREAANSPWAKASESALRAASSSAGRQLANEIGKQIFGTSRRRRSGGTVGADVVGGLVRNVLGGLFRR